MSTPNEHRISFAISTLLSECDAPSYFGAGIGVTLFGSSQSAGALQFSQFTSGRLSEYCTGASFWMVAPGAGAPFCTAVRFSSGNKSPLSAVSINSGGTLLGGNALQPLTKDRPVQSLTWL